MRKLHSVLGLTVMLLCPLWSSAQAPKSTPELNHQLLQILNQIQYKGTVGQSLPTRIGRPVKSGLADLGRLLWFDTKTGLNDDNTCAGCHSPTNGFADTQSIAIGIENNGVVGPDRKGPRNMRRTPTAANTAFYPNLMWNSRFAALSRNPFDNSSGFQFPLPEGFSLSYQPHLLNAQAFIPPTERTEVAGFAFPGDNYAIRTEVLNRLNAIPSYRNLFGEQFPDVKNGGPITFDMFGAAIAEFEFTLVFADAPLDRFARGDMNAMNDKQKLGGILFFGKAGCSSCHVTSGDSNEMFSDFKDHVAGTPQISPKLTNNNFDGPAVNEDFGLEEISGDPADRYKFRTSPLRNLAAQPTYFHNGAFTNLSDAIKYHLDPSAGSKTYTPQSQHLDADLAGPLGPSVPVLERLDPLLKNPPKLSPDEFSALVSFVQDALLDQRALGKNLKYLVPDHVPSGVPTLTFQFEKKSR